VVGIKHVRFFLCQFVITIGENYYSFVKLFGFSMIFRLDLKPNMKFSIYIGHKQNATAFSVIVINVIIK